MKTFLAAIASGLFAAVATAVFITADVPHCPTEDSCSVDYHDGGWHITEVTP